MDSNNVTLEWPRPEGRVETYVVVWFETTTPNKLNKKNVTQIQNETGPVRLLVGDLIPGVEYTFNIKAVSNDLQSDITKLRTRTSKCLFVFGCLKPSKLFHFYSALDTIRGGGC